MYGEVREDDEEDSGGEEADLNVTLSAGGVSIPRNITSKVIV